MAILYISNMPIEIQHRILSNLSETDLKQLYCVSAFWRTLVRDYMNLKTLVPREDWRWYCRHTPQKERCQVCFKRLRERQNSEQKKTDWEWWTE